MKGWRPRGGSGISPVWGVLSAVVSSEQRSSGRGATREGPASCGEGCPGSPSSGEASDWGRRDRETGKSADPKWCLLGTFSNICELTLRWILVHFAPSFQNKMAQNILCQRKNSGLALGVQGWAPSSLNYRQIKAPLQASFPLSLRLCTSYLP